MSNWTRRYIQLAQFGYQMPSVTVRDVFQDCQKGIHSHGKLIKTLTKIYNATPFEEFWEVFLAHLRYSLIVFKREPTVERTLDFAARFAVSLADKDKDGDGDAAQAEEAEEMNLFVVRLFNFLLQSHNACDQAVRYRCCQMVNKLLSKMGEEAQIDDDLYDKIYECMLQRLRDKYPVVRVQAVFALSRLQDPSDQDCPIIDAYLFLLGCDLNSDVRRAVLMCIAPSTKTLPALLERTRDIKDVIRKQAYQVLADKVHIKALTIAQRVRLLQTGLSDRVEAVRDACVNQLLQNWLRTFESNILELLKCLDVENSLETAEKMLRMLFKKVPHHELVTNFGLLNQELVIPVEELSCESVLYWRVLCEHLKDAGAEAEEQLEKMMPNVTPYCNYVKQLFDMMCVEEDLDAQLQNEFILTQLLFLAGAMDLADEVGRRHMQKLIHDMLVHERVSHSLVKPILARFSELHRDPEQRIITLVEIISEIREPISAAASGLSADVQRQLDLKLAGVRVELNQLREELDTCVHDQNFERAAEIKQRVVELETSKNTIMEESRQEIPEQRIERNDPQTLLKCLTIAAEMLTEVSFKTLLPSLLTLIEVLVLPGIQNEDPAVRNMAVRALGLCCLMHKDTAKAHLLLFVQISQVDMETVQGTALQVIFDLLHTFGLDAFQVEADSVEEEEDEGPQFETDSENELDDSDLSDDFEGPSMMRKRRPKKAPQPAIVNTANSLLSILTTLLDSDCSEIRTISAEGLAKLLLSGRVVSPKLLSRLLLLWYNPVTEDDTHLRHCLGTFFPVYAFACRSTQDVVADAVLPTLRILFNAPASSPLAEINVNNVAELLVQLTNHKHIVQANSNTDMMEGTCHDALAVKLSNEILSDPNSFNTRTLCKILNLLELTVTDRPGLKDLKVLGTRMLKEVKEKQCAKMLQKFQRQVKDYLRTLSTGSTANDTTMYDTADETKLERQGSHGDDTTVMEIAGDATSNEAADTEKTGETTILADGQLEATKTTKEKSADEEKNEEQPDAADSGDGEATKPVEESDKDETEPEESETSVKGKKVVKGKTKHSKELPPEEKELPPEEKEVPPEETVTVIEDRALDSQEDSQEEQESGEQGSGQQESGQQESSQPEQPKDTQPKEQNKKNTKPQKSSNTSSSSQEAESEKEKDAEAGGDGIKEEETSEEEPVCKKSRPTRGKKTAKEPEPKAKQPAGRATRGRSTRAKPASTAAPRVQELAVSDSEDTDSDVFASPTPIRRSSRAAKPKQSVAEIQKKLEVELESQDSELDSPAPKKTRPTRTSARRK